MNKKMSRLIIVILIVGIISIMILMLEDSLNNPSRRYEQYMRNSEYSKALRIEKFLCTYYEFRESWAEPLVYAPIDFETEYDGFYAIYDGIKFLFLDMDNAHSGIKDSYLLFGAIITDEKYEFGRLGIRVGTKKLKTQIAYALCPPLFETDENKLGYIDGIGLDVRFQFDKKNRVNEISIMIGEG